LRNWQINQKVVEEFWGSDDPLTFPVMIRLTAGGSQRQAVVSL